mgnify:CR=1 FL=1
MSEETLIKTYVRSQWRLEGDLTMPQWLEGDKRKWWLEEAIKIELDEMQSV